MTEFERILEKCLLELEQGASSVDECLARHPEHAAQLKPVLLTATYLARGRDLQPSVAFEARGRAKLTQHMQAHPRRRSQSGPLFMRFAAGLIAVLLALVTTGMAYAQTALPGDLLYDWKLASEDAWRAVSPDTVAVDIAIANRRINEFNSVADDPDRRTQALEGYLEVVTRLETEVDAETLKNILPAVPSVDGSQQPAPSPTDSSSDENVEPPAPTALPELIPTLIPEVIPTIQFPFPLP